MKFENIINKIIAEKISVYFVSPHLDDAALSCGGLISYLAEKTEVTVISVFTETSPSPHTLSARMYLRQCQNTDAEQLFERRKSEDKQILNSSGVTIKHLNFVDALWRKKKEVNFLGKLLGNIVPEILHVYPTYRFHAISGRISSCDIELAEEIKKALLSVVDDKQKFVVFCPAAVGNHVDHMITKKCCQEVFEKSVLWSDFPYGKENKLTPEEFNEYHEFMFDGGQENRMQMIKSYKTQYAAMFGGTNAYCPDERYYIKKNFLINLE